jgi:hypothetical protein
MEPGRPFSGQETALELAPERGTVAFSARRVLAAAVRAWSRNFWSLTGTLVFLRLPGLALDLAWPRVRHEFGMRALLGLVVQVGCALAAATALAAGGLDALGGRRPSIGSLLHRGIASAWRLLSASVRAFPWGTGAALLVLAVSLSRGLGAFHSHGATVALGVVEFLAFLILLINVPICWVRVYPLPALLVEELERTSGALVQRARELTVGRRWQVLPLFLMGVLFSTVETVVDYPFSASAVNSHRVAHAVILLLSTGMDGFIEILPAVAYLHLRRGQEANVAELAQVFE